MNELKPVTCIACLPWGFSEARDKARKMYCESCKGTGKVYAIPDTHRVVSVETIRAAMTASYLSNPEIYDQLRAIIDNKER